MADMKEWDDDVLGEDDTDDVIELEDIAEDNGDDVIELEDIAEDNGDDVIELKDVAEADDIIELTDAAPLEEAQEDPDFSEDAGALDLEDSDDLDALHPADEEETVLTMESDGSLVDDGKMEAEAQEDQAAPAAQDVSSLAEDISSEQVEAALERVIEKKFADKIDTILFEVMERVIEKELGTIKESLQTDLDQIGNS